MTDLSASSWLIMMIGLVIYFGGSIYTLLIAMDKKPDKFLEGLGVMAFFDRIGEKAVDAGIYKPFEYMDRGNSEKLTGLAVIFLLLIVGWQLGAFEAEEAGHGSMMGTNYELKDDSWSNSAYTSEGETTTVDQQFEGRVNVTSFTLSWTDDDTNEPPGYQNQPDSFRLTIVTPWGDEYTDEAANGGNGDGSVEIDIVMGMPPEEMDEDRIEDFEAGDWEITVECTEAGNSESPSPISVNFVDDGNEWDLAVDYSYYKELTGTGGILG